jgi:hypothetical protein
MNFIFANNLIRLRYELIKFNWQINILEIKLIIFLEFIFIILMLFWVRLIILLIIAITLRGIFMFIEYYLILIVLFFRVWNLIDYGMIIIMLFCINSDKVYITHNYIFILFSI